MRVSIYFLTIISLVLLACFPPPISAVQVPGFSGRSTEDYIVRLNPHTPIEPFLKAENIKANGKWDLINSFAVSLTKAEVASLSKNRAVKSITYDTEIVLEATERQLNAPWGLSRLTSPVKLESHRKPLSYKYFHDKNAGLGVDIYIVGIYTEHVDFQGRVTWGGTFRGNNKAIYEKPTPEQQDINGHGTQCAAIAAGKQFGVAKKANIIAVKVSNKKGKVLASAFFDGLDFIRKRYIQNGRRPSVVSLSLSCDGDDGIDQAVQSLIAEGIHVVVAAGNQKRDAGTRSPARLSSVITVGASTFKDRPTLNSNYGSSVDIFAPGDGITTATIGKPDETTKSRGTSMATAHVSGLVACIISRQGNLPPARMAEKVKEWARDGALIGLPENTVNKLAYIRTIG